MNPFLNVYTCKQLHLCHLAQFTSKTQLKSLIICFLSFKNSHPEEDSYVKDWFQDHNI